MRVSSAYILRVAFCLAMWILALTTDLPSAEFHVTPEGRDDDPGTDAQPWKTIQRAADMARPGDVVIVHEGSYREAVRPAQSGRPDALIRFQAAHGEEVFISGAEPIRDWSVHTDAVYVAKANWQVEQLFVSGRRMVRARTPNAGENPYKPSMMSGNTSQQTCSVNDQSWPKDYWKGGQVWGVGERGWVFGSSEIVSSDGDQLILADRIPFWSNGPGRLVLFGVLSALDTEREWHQQGGRVYLWAPKGSDPDGLAVEATRRRWAFDVRKRSHIQIDGFDIFAASINLDEAEHCIVENCRLRYSSFDACLRGGFNRDRGVSAESEGMGIVLGGSDNAVRKTVVAHCMGDGISVFGSNNRVEDCVIHDCNLSGSDCAPITCSGSGHTILHCTLFNAGRSVLVHRRLKQGRIEHNHIFNAGLMTGDLGATYTFQTDGEGTVIAYNRVHDVRCHTGVGIYIDNLSPNHVLHHNLCYRNSDCGIRVNTPTRNVLIVNNTLIENGKSIAWWGSRGNDDQTGVIVVNNVMTDSVSLGEGATERRNFTDQIPGFATAQEDRFCPGPKSPLIDAGETFLGITAGYQGKSPDIGCFESGSEPWQAGSSIARERWYLSNDW